MDQATGFADTAFVQRCHSSPVTPQEREKEWSWKENKMFEDVLAFVDHSSPDLFAKIASRLPGKSIVQIKEHFSALVEDVSMIESGHIPLPDYQDIAKDVSNEERGKRKRAVAVTEPEAEDNNTRKRQRKKGVTWTEEEHKLFLMGLEKYGKGDWRSISRNCVVTRTPTQIASHAQKYFLRLQRRAARQNATSSATKPNKDSA